MPHIQHKGTKSTGKPMGEDPEAEPRPSCIRTWQMNRYRELHLHPLIVQLDYMQNEASENQKAQLHIQILMPICLQLAVFNSPASV